MRSFALYFILLFGLCLHVDAREFTFRMLGLNVSAQDLRYAVGKQDVPVVLNEHGFSPAYACSSGGGLDFSRLVIVDEKETREVVFTMPAPPGPSARWLLLVAAEKSAGTLRYSGRWIDDSSEAHPVNTVRLYNFTGRMLMYQSGSESNQVSFGEPQLIPFATGVRQIPFRLAALRDGHWKLAAATRLPVRKNYRVHVIVRDGTAEDQLVNSYVDLLLVHDYVPPPIP
ncbi:MAG: hypothetical protein WC205_03835 [Opitutaceae bacterium]|jgi:hypothetical protein